VWRWRPHPLMGSSRRSDNRTKKLEPIQQCKKNIFMPRRRGAMDIASASGTGRPGFKSRQGIRFFRET
jgi:hypothetical protein